MEISDKVVLNNGYAIPRFYLGPAQPVGSVSFSNDTRVNGSSDAFKSSDGCTAPLDDVVSAALDAGYRGFDSGARYGTEEDLGRIFRTCGIPRDELFITTKVNNTMQGYDSTLRDFEASMGKLDLEYVDIYMIHCPVPVKGLYCDTWRAFEEIYRSGRAKAIGVSNFTVEHMRRLSEISDIVPAVNQIEQHPFFVQPNLKTYERERGIVSMSYSPLGQGKFAHDPRLRSLAEKHGKTVAQVILRWHLQMGYVPITRSTSPDRVRENADVFDFELDDSDMAYMGAHNHGERVWHDPDRFPGTAAHVRIEKSFRAAVERAKDDLALAPRTRCEIDAEIEAMLSSTDVDGTIDFIIACFFEAARVYGPNAEVEDQAEEIAERHALAVVSRIAGKE